MARDRNPRPDPPVAPESPQASARAEAEAGPKDPRGGGRRPTALEGIFQEAVRRAAGVGFSSFFLTEEALRKAFTEKAPQELVEFVNQRGDEVRDQVIERASREFGDWLRSIDARELLGELLTEYEFKFDVSVSAVPKSHNEGSSLKVVTRRK